MIGSACKYFEGAFTPEYIKWQMPWSEFMLYLASIPQYDIEGAGNEKIEVKDATELF